MEHLITCWKKPSVNPSTEMLEKRKEINDRVALVIANNKGIARMRKRYKSVQELTKASTEESICPYVSPPLPNPYLDELIKKRLANRAKNDFNSITVDHIPLVKRPDYEELDD